MPSPPHSGIAQAMQALETERAHLTARLTKLDEAIATMRDLFHLPNVVTAAGRLPRRTTAPASNGNGHVHLSDTAARIREVLSAGPLSPRELSARLDIDRANLRRPLQDLQASSVIVATGSTGNRRYALADGRPKEAP